MTTPVQTKPAAGVVPPTWTTGSTAVFKTGTWRAALAQHVVAPSPCHQACPVDGDIAEWLGLARQGDWRGAWEVLVRHNPFPAITGRVCHHPCEAVSTSPAIPPLAPAISTSRLARREYVSVAKIFSIETSGPRASPRLTCLTKRA